MSVEPTSAPPIWRIRWILAASFTLAALIATAQAERKKPLALPELRAGLAAQLTAEAETIGKALATVTTKLADADAVRGRHLAAAYRLVRDQRADDDDTMTIARRRAAAQLLLQRDHQERTLLADEANHLKDAAVRVARDQASLTELAIPPMMIKPARGAIARHFGTLLHDKSKATLTRHGIDIDVEPHVEAVVPADGVVRYAGPIRGLDTGVIIDHGSCLTVIGKLGDVAVPVGAKLLRGDRLGHAARERIYFEVRVKLGPGGLPIDPEPLLEPEPSRTRAQPSQSRAQQAQ